MKITKTRLMEIIKEETRSLVEEDDINIQRVTDIDQMVKNFLTTASMEVGLRGQSREDFFRGNLDKIVQYIINGEIYHYTIPDGLFLDAEDIGVEDDSIWAKMKPTFDKFDAAGSSGMKPQPPKFPKLKNIKELADIDAIWRRRDSGDLLEKQKIKLTKTRLMEIIKEEVIKEVSSEEQRHYMCAMKDKEADERPDGLSQDEAEEMCTGPMKEEEIDEGLFGLGKSKDQGPKYAKYPDVRRSSVPMDATQAGNVENLLQKVAEIINIEENNPESSPESKQLALKQAQHLMAQAVFHRVLEEEDLEEGWFGNKTKKQTKRTAAMTKRADDTLGRFSGEKTKKPKLSPDDELQQMSDKKKSDDDLLALKKKMGLAEKKRETSK